MQGLQSIMGSVAARLFLVAGVALVAVWGLQATTTGGQDDPTSLKQMLEVGMPLLSPASITGRLLQH
jgi:hypothetical protein